MTVRTLIPSYLLLAYIALICDGISFRCAEVDMYVTCLTSGWICEVIIILSACFSGNQRRGKAEDPFKLESTPAITSPVHIPYKATPHHSV